jgi:cation-transporting P-type ATPase F
VNAIVAMEAGYLFACRSLRLSIFQIGIFKNPHAFLGAGLMLVAQLGFTYMPIMNRLFHSAPLDAEWWLVLTALGGAIFVGAELAKVVVRSVTPPPHFEQS